jgi:hypothetical protein
VKEKLVLSAEEIASLKDSAALMKSGRLRNGETRNSNVIRTQFNSFLRACWEELPGAKQYDLYSHYRCTDSDYAAIVARVADMIHKFLFFGLDSLALADGGSEPPVSFYTRDGLYLKLLINTNVSLLPLML